MPKQDIEALIRWRDATADNYGSELPYHKIHAHLINRDVPEEFRAAQREFQVLSEHDRYKIISETLGETAPDGSAAKDASE